MATDTAPASGLTRRRSLLVFLCAEVLLSFWLYRDALWGGSLLAPLDCAPTMMSKYQFVNPASGRLPANHYIIDLLTYDLPVQHTVYQSYRQGVMPWWDPYVFGGRPLLAEAQINGTDPLRLFCYATLPFELAYNWVRVLASFLCGLGMFLLLRSWKLNPWIVILLALAYQFSPFFMAQFMAPSVQASMAFYPWIWLAWEGQWRKPNAWSYPVATLAVAGFFYSGNLQSHSYLVLMAAAFLLGYGGRLLAAWRRLLPIVVVSGILGGLLATPVLLSQVELFTQNTRDMGAPPTLLSYGSGLASLSAVYPWVMGTFRTLDLCRAFGPKINSLGFHLFIGSVGVVMALVGAWQSPGVVEREPVRRTAIWLVATYLVVLSTPLLGIFYTRLAGTALMGLVILAAFGVEWLWQRPEACRRLGWLVGGLVVLLALGTHVGALLVYPKLEGKVRAFVQKQAPKNPSLDQAPALREFQVHNLPDEVTFKNPETLFASLSLAALALACFSVGFRRHRLALPLVLTLNLLPEMAYCGRFMPRQPSEQWRRLLAGGPEQQKVRQVLGQQPMRLLEISPGTHEMLLPRCLGHLYQIRTVHGYASLQPRGVFFLSSDQRKRYAAQLADYVYESKKRAQSAGVLVTNAVPGSVLFQWQQPTPRPIQVRFVSLNELQLTFPPGAAETLTWTDTYFPGWHASADSKPVTLTPAAPCFSRIDVPAGAGSVVLRYEPTYFRTGLWLAAFALLALAGISLLQFLRLTKSPGLNSTP